MHHLTHDGTGADDGDLHHEVIHLTRCVARDGSHLRAAFHLKHAHGVGLAQRIPHVLCVFLSLGQLCQIHGFVVVFGDQPETVLHDGHHAQSQQIDLHQAEIVAVFFIPLHHAAAGHGGALQRHHAIQVSLADHHAAGVLPKMTRQILKSLAELNVLRDAPVVDVKARVAEIVFERFVFSLPLPVADQAGKAAQRFLIKAQGLAHLACGAFAAVGDDIGGHGRAEFAIALIHVLDCLFTLVARG